MSLKNFRLIFAKFVTKIVHILKIQIILRVSESQSNLKPQKNIFLPITDNNKNVDI